MFMHEKHSQMLSNKHVMTQRVFKAETEDTVNGTRALYILV